MIKNFKDANSSKITNSLYIIPLDTQFINLKINSNIHLEVFSDDNC